MSDDYDSSESREDRELVLQIRADTRIVVIRDRQVMLDADLAELYRIRTKALVQAVKRNIERFPDDFMFQLSREELEDWRSQIVTSNPAAKMGLRRRPYAFTEHGILMLSSVLRSPRAVEVNIEIMRTFVRLRRMVATHEELAQKVAAMEKRYDARFRAVFDALRKLLLPPAVSTKRIGFRQPPGSLSRATLIGKVVAFGIG